MNSTQEVGRQDSSPDPSYSKAHTTFLGTRMLPGILLEVLYSCVLNSFLPADSLAQMLSLPISMQCLNQLPARSEPQNSPGEGTLPRSSAGTASLGLSPGTHGPYSPGGRSVHHTLRLHSVSAADSHCFPATCCPALCLWDLFPPLLTQSQPKLSLKGPNRT